MLQMVVSEEPNRLGFSFLMTFHWYSLVLYDVIKATNQSDVEKPQTYLDG